MTNIFEEMFGSGFPKHRSPKAEEAPEQTFETWYAALERGKPALTKATVHITRENFKAAMRQAYEAGEQLG